jgi:NADH-quinone oxidoreductase subunit A
MQSEVVVPIVIFLACVLGLAVVLLAISQVFNPKRGGAVNRMPYESGMDPVHDTRRQFDVRFHLMAIAFIVFDVEVLFLYPWAVANRPAAEVPPAAAAVASAAAPSAAMPSAGLAASPHREFIFAAVMLFIALLTLGLFYDWRKGVFRWR